MTQHQIGQITQVIAERFQRQQALQIHCQQAECLFLLYMAQYIQLPLGIFSTVIQAGLQFEVELRPLRGLIHFASIKQFVKQHRVQRQVFAGPAAGGDHIGQSL